MAPRTRVTHPAPVEPEEGTPHPLFPVELGQPIPEIGSFTISRLEPGNPTPELLYNCKNLEEFTDEMQIGEKWGGGTYKLRARNLAGQFVGLDNTFRIPGPPKREPPPATLAPMAPVHAPAIQNVQDATGILGVLVPFFQMQMQSQAQMMQMTMAIMQGNQNANTALFSKMLEQGKQPQPIDQIFSAVAKVRELSGQAAPASKDEGGGLVETLANAFAPAIAQQMMASGEPPAPPPAPAPAPAPAPVVPMMQRPRPVAPLTPAAAPPTPSTGPVTNSSPIAGPNAPHG